MSFEERISASYTFKGETLLAGVAMHDGQAYPGCPIRIPLKTMNRHGLIAGATGTGKTKSLQLIAEGLSDAGVPVLLMDIKGDASGLAQPGMMNPIIRHRSDLMGLEWKEKGYPVELMSISDEPGVKLRATVSEFGPVLLGKLLNLNENQGSILSLIFKYCDDKGLPLLDIKDLTSVINYINTEGKAEFTSLYGHFQTSSTGIIQRQMVALGQQGADQFFGEPSFEAGDLLRRDHRGLGYINILRLSDIQAKPDLFSTFMLCLLAEIFQKFPEKGDLSKPELVIFIDEAHLVFRNATRTLLEQLDMTIKLIRSKGVGIFFVTQVPDDIPANILSQLGLKVQHALRAFTANDRKSIKAAAENYPLSDFYKTNDLITQLGIGEALITALNEKGIPTELAHTLMRPPCSRMDILTPQEIQELNSRSELVRIYNRPIDRQSAHEILFDKINRAAPGQPERATTGRKTKEKSLFEEVMKSPLTRTIVREAARGLFGVMGVKTRR
ncbi:MAG: helicase HerA-like domain-containing protein [Bacteroidales bacterium]